MWSQRTVTHAGHIVVSDDPQIQQAAFKVIEQYGPRDASEIAGKAYNIKRVIIFTVESLLLAIPMVGIGWLGSIGTVLAIRQTSSVPWETLVVYVSVIIILFSLICRALTAWLAFRYPDILNILRRDSFGSNWWLGAIIGFLFGIAICSLISQQTGLLLPENSEQNALITIAATLIIGQMAGVLGVLLNDKNNLKITLAYFGLWKNTSRSV